MPDSNGEKLSSVLDQVRSLRPLIESCADDQATQITAELMDALDRSDIYALMAPRVVGGLEAEPHVLIDAIRELSYYDGSTGWYCGAILVAGAVCGAFLGDRAIEAIFARDGRARCAGQAAPQGKAEKVGNGYRISGSFSFGSGTPSAEWIVGAYVVHKDGAPVKTETGQPQILIGIAPRSKVEFRGNWDVLGLRATGSYDFRVLEQVIHEDFTLSLNTPTPRRGGTLYKMGFMALPALTHGSVAIGCSRRALDEWAEFAKTKPRPAGGHLNEMHTVQRDLAMAHGDLRGAEAYLRNTFAEIYASAGRGSIPDALKVDGRLSASYATIVGSRAAQTAFGACTTAVLRNGNRLQRCHRDMQAAVSHMLTGQQSIIDAGSVLAGAPGAVIAF